MNRLLEVVYAGGINEYGLYSPRPVVCVYNAETKSWWGDEKFEIRELGYFDYGHYITFASVFRHDVDQWLRGALAAVYIIRRWTLIH